MLAQISQSVEMKLLLPVIDLAMTTKDFRVMLWQHDGFSVSFHSKGRKERWIRRIKQVVQEEADLRGIPTGLDIKNG